MSSAKKKVSLSEALNQSKETPLSVVAPQAQTEKSEKRIHAHIRLSEEALKQLRFMSVETDKSQQQLMVEALNDLFAKYGKARIA